MRREGFISVADGENPRPLVHVAADHPVAVVGPVVMQMRLQHDVQNFLVHLAGLQHVNRDIVMQRHQLGFVRAEFPRLEQDMVGHADLPNVVQERRDFQHLELVFVPSQILGHTHAKQCHPSAVQDRIMIPVMECREQAPEHIPRNRPGK